MYCNQCGSGLPAGVAYCTHCGKAVGGIPAAPAAAAYAAPSPSVGRVTKHRNVLGVLWLVAGLLDIPAALVMLGLSSTQSWRWNYDYGWSGAMPHFLVPLFGGIGAALIIFGVLKIALAVGLLQTQSWARMLAIVLAIVELIRVPFGTALGIYTLWVLMSDASDVEYNALARARARV